MSYMYWIFGVSLVLSIVFFILGQNCSDSGHWLDYTMAGMGYICLAFFVIYGIALVVTLDSFHKAKSEAEIINQKFGTAYTQEQVFFSKDLIGHLEGVDIEELSNENNNTTEPSGTYTRETYKVDVHTVTTRETYKADVHTVTTKETK